MRVRPGVQCDEAARVPDAVVEVADAQRGQAAPLAHQPCLEGRTAGELHAFQQFPAEPRQTDRVLPARGREHVDVEAHGSVAGKAQHRPGQGAGLAEQAAHLAEIPPQGAAGSCALSNNSEMSRARGTGASARAR